MQRSEQDTLAQESAPEQAIEVIAPKPIQRAAVLLSPVMDIALAKQRLAEFQEFVSGYMKEGEDYGTIPGTPKPTLYKPGADKLCELYGLSDDYVLLQKVENFDAEPALFDYTIKCILRSRRDDSLVSTGLGSCNSYEGKYKFREQQRVCPSCGKTTIFKGQQDKGGGWFCWKKKDGCGARFADGDKAIESQTAGKVFNDDISTLKNTILKMAKKRAKVDATLAATRSSGIFTQDVEDMSFPNDDGSGSKAAAQEVAKAKIVNKVQVQYGQANGKSVMWINGPGCALLGNLLRSTGKHIHDWGVWTIPGGADAVTIIEECGKQGIQVREVTTLVPAKSPAKDKQGAAKSELTQPHEEPPEAVLGKTIHLVITKTHKNEPLKTSNGAPFVKVGMSDGRTFYAFNNFKLPVDGNDQRFFELLENAKPGTPAEFEIEIQKNYPSIKRVLSLGGLEWDTEGVQVIRYKATDDDVPEKMR